MIRVICVLQELLWSEHVLLPALLLHQIKQLGTVVFGVAFGTVVFGVAFGKKRNPCHWGSSRG